MLETALVLHAWKLPTYPDTKTATWWYFCFISNSCKGQAAWEHPAAESEAAEICTEHLWGSSHLSTVLNHARGEGSALTTIGVTPVLTGTALGSVHDQSLQSHSRNEAASNKEPPLKKNLCHKKLWRSLPDVLYLSLENRCPRRLVYSWPETEGKNSNSVVIICFYLCTFCP